MDMVVDAKRIMSLGICALLALMAAQVSLAATIVVDDTNCTIDLAIVSANNGTQCGTSSYSGSSGPDTIQLTNMSSPKTLSAALANIVSDITIEGAGKALDANDNYRHFIVTSGGKLTLNNIILNKGKSSQAGGSIYVASGGQLTLIKVTVGNAEAGGNGGGIFIASGATATIQGESRIHDNEAVNGGGIYSRGSLTIIDTVLEGNKAKTIGSATGEYGGGIYIAGGSATVRGGSIIRQNTAEVEHGGGIYISSGSITISNSSIVSNTAEKSGGGIDVVLGARLVISNSSVSKNRAKNDAGGGISFAGSNSTISHVTMMDNISDASNTGFPSGLYVWSSNAAKGLSLRNSIIASSDGNADCATAGNASLKQNVGNFIGKNQCSPAASGTVNLDTTDEPNWYTPNSGSPVLGIGNAAICQQYSLDQLGVRRPATGCDAGSVELGGENWIYVDSDCTLNDAITAANTNNSVSNSGCEAGIAGALDVIWLRQNVTLSANLPEVTGSARIEGGGRTIDGGDSYEMFKLTTTINLTIKNVTLKDGRTANSGGAISNAGGTITVSNVTFDSNSSPGSGGAIDLDSGTITVHHSAFLSNVASFTGGAVDVSNGTLTITNSTFVDNTTINHGGAIYISSGTVTLAHLTLWNNRNTYSGGDWVDAIQAGGTTNMYNTIIGRDSVSSHKLCGGAFNNSTEERGNLIHNPASTDGCPQATEGDPLLGGLTGSPGFLPLGAGSAAIGAGRPATCTAYPRDQRGAARSLSNCDIGAVQYYAVATDDEAEEEDSGSGRRSPTATPICSGDYLNWNTGIRVRATYGLCSGVQFTRITGAGVGNQSVIDSGFIDGVDVWGYAEQGVEVCFPAYGAMALLDAATSPRTLLPLQSYLDGHLTCASFATAGTAVLVHANSGLSSPPVSHPLPDELSGCMVTTTYVLNLRAAPNGEIIGMVAHNATLTALSRVDGWYQVDANGVTGWISADYVVADGMCG